MTYTQIYKKLLLGPIFFLNDYTKEAVGIATAQKTRSRMK